MKLQKLNCQLILHGRLESLALFCLIFSETMKSWQIESWIGIPSTPRCKTRKATQQTSIFVQIESKEISTPSTWTTCIGWSQGEIRQPLILNGWNSSSSVKICNGVVNLTGCKKRATDTSMGRTYSETCWLFNLSQDLGTLFLGAPLRISQALYLGQIWLSRPVSLKSWWV